MSRNPFLDLGFPPEEAAALHIRSQLAVALEHYIDRNGWSQTEAAKALMVPQQMISKIVNGNTKKLSIERLIKRLVRTDLPGGIWGSRAVSVRPRATRPT
jgi:predicted XRE-type DNA-binding protein